MTVTPLSTPGGVGLHLVVRRGVQRAPPWRWSRAPRLWSPWWGNPFLGKLSDGTGEQHRQRRHEERVDEMRHDRARRGPSPRRA